jgi:hypothetical protein
LNLCKERNPDEPLTYKDIVNGFDGFFIGRLLRIKQTFKENKESPIPLLYLGFLDLNG